MILEGIVTTLGTDDMPHLAAMGAAATADLETLVLRPYASSTTCQNLQRNSQGVFHITDDVELIVQGALGRPSTPAEMVRVPGFSVPRLGDCCRWFAFQVREIDARAERIAMDCLVVDRGWQRDFVGFNRAKHAILELTIMATRIPWLSADDIGRELERARVIVAKTAGPAEERAFAVVSRYISECLGDRSAHGR